MPAKISSNCLNPLKLKTNADDYDPCYSVFSIRLKCIFFDYNINIIQSFFITCHRLSGGILMEKNKRVVALLVFAVFLISIAPMVMAADGEKININTATAEQLIKLKRIGPKYAEKIIQYRETNGPFKAVEDITNVKGIGPKTVEANIDVMTVE